MTRSEQLLAEKTVCIFMLRGKNAAMEDVYAYVAVRADQIDAFIDAQAQPDFNPEHYGVILESGIGTPSQKMREKMEQEYGCQHEKAVELNLPHK